MCHWQDDNGRRTVQTPNRLPGSWRSLGVAATSGRENGLDVAAAADGICQRRGWADQVGLSCGLEDGNVGEAVPDVVELRVAKDATNGFHLAVALGVVSAVARNHA